MKQHPSVRSLRPARLCAAAVLCMPMACAWAQQQPAQERTNSNALDRLSISVGGFYARPTVNAGIVRGDAALRTGDIRLDEKTLPRISIEALLGDHHGLSFEAYRYSNRYSDRFQGTYSAGPFDAGVNVDLSAKFKLDVARLGYRYWFGDGDTVIGVGGGVGYYRVELASNASGSVVDLGNVGFEGGAGTYSKKDKDDAFAPMLELGIRHAVRPDVRLFLDASGIKKSGGSGVRGSIYNAAAGVEWFPARNLGVTLGYAVSDVNLERDSGSLRDLRVKFHGPVASVKMRF